MVNNDGLMYYTGRPFLALKIYYIVYFCYFSGRDIQL